MFNDRKDAGQQLADKLISERFDDPIVLALPRGGVPVAYEVAKTLNAPMDLILVKKIGIPSQPELAVGAVVEGNPPQLVINEDIKSLAGVGDGYIEVQKAKKLEEIARRRALYFADRPPPLIEGRDVILVDDGIATGATVKAAIKGLRAQNPKRLILAIPVAPHETIRELKGTVDKIICLDQPSPFAAIGIYFRDFHQLEDHEVISFLEKAAKH